MFDHSKLADVLVAYKQNFVAKQWGDEKYKWEAVKWFQDNWDVNSADFAEMLNRSLDKTFNLLASNNNFPKGMIVGFAKSAPEEVRAMFIALFDESKDVFERMDAFKMQSSILLEKYGNGAAQHYQYENAISTYLWLRYPDKYYIYKFGEVKTVANELGSDYMTEKRYENLVAVLRNKKNIILQGAPGVGKTFAARRLAWSMMGEKDDSRIEFVQFHQNYSYEDFMMGYKPVDDGFELKYGIFYRFCQKAANQPDKEFFFIIDEINRGNMSKIFGELLMLIEKDYRGTKATLAYNGLSFSVPKNLYIIGMMNTADRSLAMIDYALRRRFSFFEVEPGFDSEGFIHYQNSLNNETLNELVNKVKDLNREISLDKSLGKGFCIGHSYFCGRDICTEEWMHSIVDYDILPMLSEYWFDDANKLQRWENILQGVFQ